MVDILLSIVVAWLPVVVSILTLVVLWWTLRQVVRYTAAAENYTKTAIEYTKAAQRQNNLRLVPILAIEARFIAEAPSVRPSDVELTLANLGFGPAFNVEIEPIDFGKRVVSFRIPEILAQDKSWKIKPDARKEVGNELTVNGLGESWNQFLLKAPSSDPNKLSLDLHVTCEDVQKTPLSMEFRLEIKRMGQSLLYSHCRLIRGPDLSAYDEAITTSTRH